MPPPGFEQRRDGPGVWRFAPFRVFMNPEDYTVLDWRAANVLTDEGILNQTISDDASIDEYMKYLRACRSTAEQFDVSLRELDRALWVLGENHE